MTFAQLFQELDRHESRLPLDVLNSLLQQLEVDWDQIAPLVKFNTESYRRNLMHAGPAYHALILCWKHGQRSPIHDHRGSSCGVRVLKGTCTETIFDRTPDGHIFAISSKKLSVGYTCGSQDDDIHQISNLEADHGDLITLHIYSPPLLVMGTYSLTSLRRGEFTDQVFAFCEGGGI